MPPGAGNGFITRQCRKSGWRLRKKRWLAAVADYHRFRGNPWLVLPAGFTGAPAKALYRLYDTRGSSGPIARIRRPAAGFQSCPMCGSLGGRSLDHALPRSLYPEFSILHENLVPSCTMCNSDEKGSTYRGVRRSQRFIHPYYDKWASSALWRVKFGPDLDALQFEPISLATLSRHRRLIVNFHIQTLLGKEWREAVRREWAALPAKLHRRLGKSPTVAAVRAELNTRLLDTIDTYGVNSWDAGFLRGALADASVTNKLISRIQALPV